MDNQQTTDKEEIDAKRLANCFAFVRDMFPNLPMSQALKTAAALQAALFKE